MFGYPIRKTSGTRKTTGVRPTIELLEHRVVLSTFKVNTTLDAVAVNLTTGKDASGQISLRSAIMAANVKSNSDTIILPAGNYTLTIPGAGEDNAATGDLDIHGSLTIKGAGANSTTIDANSLDRVFQIFSGKVTISGVTIRDGQATFGGGIFNGGGQVTLSNDVITGNCAVGAPGGGDGDGGGVFNAAGSLSVTNTTFGANGATGGAGSQGLAGFAANGAAGGTGVNGAAATGGNGGNGGSGGAALGGAIYNAAGASLTLSGAEIAADLATGGVGGNGGAGGVANGGNGVRLPR